MQPALIKKIVEELCDELAGGVVSKVHQPGERFIVLRIYVRGGEKRLLVSAEALHPRIHLTTSRFVNPQVPKRFCAYLRSRITGARVESVEQVDGERIVRVRLLKSYDSQSEIYTVVAELTGKSSNIILLDGGGVVLDALRYFQPETSVRVVVPGVVLEPLPPAAVKGAAAGFCPAEGESWNSAAERFYTNLVMDEGASRLRTRLGRAIRQARKKALRKVENLRRDEQGAKKGLEFYKYGELLITSLHMVKRGAREAELTDYTVVPPGVVTVPLDEKMGPRENAERYFKKAKKSKVALEMLKERIPEAEEEAEYLDTLLFELERAASKQDLELVEEEMIQGGYIKAMGADTGSIKDRSGKEKQDREAGREPVRRVTSSEGFEILCGKSGSGNDMLVQKIARGEDIWFHAHRVPGSHVLIKVAGRAKELTRATIEEAASWAAFHSKAQGAMKVEVIYTPARNVKKPKGSKPGLVTVREHKTINVKPKDLESESP